eukprot:TRINITY_DN62088_c0_g1_i1.p1 TRINITY_DN62088_c0_g1~~TRINITY_DN62088_c0_g1_i1.p1  ORF type:complete len:1389 (+),score=235.01 TRINITY_DN62088_c0_g1_i1:57-4169(+)
MAAASVDTIWEEMQREHWKKAPSAERASKVFDLSSLQFEQKKKKKPLKQLDASMQWMQNWSAKLKPRSEVGVVLEVEGVGGTEVCQTEPPSTLIDAVEEIPMETPETFLAYLQRDVNCLAEENMLVRLQSLQKLERVLVRQANSLPTDIMDAVGEATLKPLLKRLKDKSEKCREISARILKSVVESTSDLSSMLPYIFPTLVSRLGCEDLDGIAHLPEAMRPAPEQKPTEIARPVEDSEEVRLELAGFVAAVLARCSPTQIYSYVDEATGLLRAQAMDPFHEVKAFSLETMASFCYNHSEMLLHFAPVLGRSLTSCLTHNHAKIRIAAMRTLTAVLHCGTWKTNFEVLQILMAWQDPNSVPIKAFYEPTTNVNYMSMLSFDRHPAVRRFWFETLAHWLLRIPDKTDHEPYIFPYLLTGLCDENEEIALEVFWLLEKCGELYEAEHEQDLRKTKQYGFDFGWTYQGRAFVPFPLRAIWAGGGFTGSARRLGALGPDIMGQAARDDKRHLRDLDTEEIDYGEEVEVPVRNYAWPALGDVVVHRNLPRPRLGSRCWVRTNTRRYIKATFNDVVDFRDCTALNAGRLLCMSIAYTEEGVTEWLQPMFAAIIKFYSGRAAASGDSQVMRTFDCICKLLGSFLDPVSFWEQLKDALSTDSTLYLDQRVASLRVLSLCIEGSVEALQSVEPHDPALGLGRLKNVIPELITEIHSSDLLLAPSESSREVMWRLVFSFLDPLGEHLNFGQISQLLYVVLALAARAPVEVATSDVALVSEAVEMPQFEEEELVDPARLQVALDVLSKHARVRDSFGVAPSSSGGAIRALPPITPPSMPVVNLNDMDDEPVSEIEPIDYSKVASSGIDVGDDSARVDPRGVHHDLFQRAFPEVVARLDDSLQVFRSVIYLSPLCILSSPEQSGFLLHRLSSFCAPSRSPATRSAGQALAVHLAMRCSRFLASGKGEAATNVRLFTVRIFQTVAQAHLEGSKTTQALSYAVIVAGLAAWRRFFLHPLASPRDVLFPTLPSCERDESKPLQWLTFLVSDQELYKRFHAALQHATTIQTGIKKEDFVIMKAKQLRETADQRAEVVRGMAASTLLVVLRRILADGQGPVPWLHCGSDRRPVPGSARALFLAVASLFRTQEATLPPNFVKPTQPSLALYAAELLRLLLHQRCVPPTFHLRDDAARAINGLSVSTSAPVLPLTLLPEEEERFVTDFVTTLVDLNLTLPPEPEAKHAPVTLEGGSGAPGGEIFLGWDAGLSCLHASGGNGTSTISLSHDLGNCGAVPSEVTRLLAQSLECHRWNAALALYMLGLDLSVVCPAGFKRSLVQWRRNREQAKILIAADMLRRAEVAKARAAGVVSSPQSNMLAASTSLSSA